MLRRLMSYFVDYQHIHGKLPDFCVLHQDSLKPFKQSSKDMFNVKLHKGDEVVVIGVRICFSNNVPVDAIVLGDDVSVHPPKTEVL